ncbi:MupA/Atu3671 family FMN-dependent luciferase-like monooxygenase [Streptomyces sp. NPDC058872]|uniref:MupA/Atu3671 family FMN-dependent luciferase-like monooxygenase n=1 Tax=Streptomyces sp. NPDC058872 TaxID=3346661 RepID=UPI0036A7684D
MSALDAASAALDQDLAAMAELSRRITQQLAAPEPRAPEPLKPAEARVHGPRVSVTRSSGMVQGASPRSQQDHLDDLVRRYTAKTPTSKETAQRYRRVLADSRAVVGFRGGTKEMLYPIAGRRASGSSLEDVDGNRYVDITMGFGVLLFGHEPAFVTEAVREHLSRGVQLGPRAVETGEAAELLAQLTGMERVAFANSGTEANSGAIRLARAATGRTKMVVFNGAYHGHADGVLGRSSGSGSDRVTVPVSSGIPHSAVADLLVLDYGSRASLDVIERHAADIAVVVIEPVQSRHPALQPVGFVRELRELTRRHGIVLMFDEMLTGFRPALRGAQELYGVTPDLATYGKLLGGGFPIGAIAGRADIMDGVDGGYWSYGDDSYPPADTTFFGGTYIQHPVSMVAARAVLTHLKDHSPTLQERLNARTGEMAAALNAFFEAEEFPLRMSHFGSQFRFEHRVDMELLYHHLMLRGVHVWEWRNFFLSTAHTDGDIEFITDAVKDSLRELRGAGFFPGGPARPAPVPAHTSAPVPGPARVEVPAVAATSPTVSARVRNSVVTRPATSPRAGGTPRTPDFSICFFGDYPQDEAPRYGTYELVLETARFADRHGFHALWTPERHFHSFGGLFPNPAVLAAALSRETERIRLNAGSVVLPLHDPIRVAEEWSMVDNLSGGRIGLGVASGWHARDFAFFPDRFGRHRDLMYDQLDEVRRLWRGEAVRRTTGDGEDDIRLFPRPVQDTPPLYTAVVGNPASYELAARNGLGVITNLMTQSVEQLRDNIALYRRTRAEHGLDPDTGRVAVLLHTYLTADHATARAEAYEPLSRYMRSSLSLFGGVTNSLGHKTDLSGLSEDDLHAVFHRAYDRYCDQRALIGSADSVSRVVDEVTSAGADEIVSLVDFGVAPDALRAGLTHLDALRRRYAESPRPAAAPVTVRTGAGTTAETGTGTGTEAGFSDVAPLSPGQTRIWVLERLLPGRTAYNETKAIRLDGPLDVPALHSALRGLVARHEGLRTVFRQVGDEPRQLVRTPGEPDFAVVDGTGPHDAVRRVLDAESARLFDLENGPLFVTRLVALAEERHVLVLSLHHIVVDAASAAVLARDLSALYRAETDGVPAALPVIDRSYADHAREQLAALDDPKAADDLAFWLKTLDGELPVLDLPCDRPRPETMTSNGRAVFHTLDAGLSERLREVSRAHRSTLFMTLLAGYAAMLHRVTGQEDVVIGVPMTNRPQEAADLLGFFVNTLAPRFDLSGDPTFAALLGRVRSVTLDAYDHADVAFEEVVRALAPRRVTDRTPVFQVLAEFEGDEPFRFELPGVAATPLDAGPDKALTDLAVYFTDQPQGIRCHLEYNTDLFDADTVERFFGTFRELLEAAADDQQTPLSRLTAPVTDGDAVPEAWQRGPARALEDTTVHALVARRAATAPDRTAVIDGGTELTYRELEERAERLATAIRERSGPARTDETVVLWLPRSADLVVAMLAAMKSGRAYVPLDPSLGRARAEAVIAECGARTLVTTRSGAAALTLPPGLAVVTPDDRPQGTAVPGTPDPTSLCYVIHTSGSTGAPKGVAVAHRSVVNLCQWHRRRFGFTAADRSALVCSQSFDAAVLEIWPALTAGASLTIADDTVRKDPLALARWYAAERVTFSVLPTALGEAVLELPADDQPPLRHLLMGGDVMRVRPRPDTPYEVLNVYGPTEATVLCTAETVTPDGAEIAIGRPVDNVRLRVLDPSGEAVPVGAVGELHVGGAGVARGYLHRPGTSEERFPPDPAGAPGDRMYRTGDLVRWTPEGSLEFRGRIDDQVKVRGYRVEPEEVSHALGGLDGVRDAVVLARRDGRGEAYLAAFVVPADPIGEAAADRQAFADLMTDELAAKLPEYLVPRAWAVLARLPIGVNGKLDRSALPDPGIVTAAPGTAAPGATSSVPPAAPAPQGSAAGADGEGAEERLRAVWAAQLGTNTDAIEPDASFFDLGGHSITAIRLMNRVRAEYGIEYPMARFYREPTLRAMVAHLEGTATHRDPANPADPADAGTVEDRAPATSQQAGFAVMHHRHPLPQVFNVVMRLTFSGSLDVAALRTALTRLVERHESLRTRYTGAGEEWQQEVLRARPVDLPVDDLTAWTREARETEVERISTEATETPFDLSRGVAPVFRLMRTEDTTWVLLTVLHHSTCDGWAVSILLKELAALYGAAVEGVPDPLGTASPQPTAYARWQRDRTRDTDGSRKTDKARRADYWVRELGDAPFRLELPLDRPRPGAPSGKGAVHVFTVPADVRKDVEALARRRGTTPYAVTAAALGRLLADLSGQGDVLLDVSYANRESEEFESLVACTVVPMALRVRVGAADSFAALVDQVALASAQGIDHTVERRELVAAFREQLGVEVPDRLPVGFAYQNSLETDIELPGVTVSVEDLAPAASRRELSFGLIPAGDVLTGFVEYTADLWDVTTVEGWVRDYAELLAKEVRQALRDRGGRSRS